MTAINFPVTMFLVGEGVTAIFLVDNHIHSECLTLYTCMLGWGINKKKGKKGNGTFHSFKKFREMIKYRDACSCSFLSA